MVLTNVINASLEENWKVVDASKQQRKKTMQFFGKDYTHADNEGLSAGWWAVKKSGKLRHKWQEVQVLNLKRGKSMDALNKRTTM